MNRVAPVLSAEVILDGGPDDYQRIRNIQLALLGLSDGYTQKISLKIYAKKSSVNIGKLEELARKRAIQVTTIQSQGGAQAPDDSRPKYEVQLSAGFISPNYFQTTIEVIEGMDGQGVIIPGGAVSYGEINTVVDFRGDPQGLMGRLLHDGVVPRELPVAYPVVNNDRVVPPLIRVGSAVKAGTRIHVSPDALYFYRHAEIVSLANPDIIRNDALSPVVFAKQNIADAPPQLTDVSARRMYDSIRTRHPAAFEYVRGQYHLNRHYLGLLYAKANRKIATRSEIKSTISTLVREDKSLNSSWMSQWAALNAIEPMIRPSLDILRSVRTYDHTYVSEFSKRYARFCNKYATTKITDIVMLPHLVRGGADLAAINFIKALSEQGRYPLVIISLEVESPWIHQIADMQGVQVVEAREWFAGLEEEWRSAFVCRIAAQWKVKHFSVINSSLGYRILEDYGHILRDGCKTMLHTYAFDMTSDGFIYNVLQDGIKKCSRNVDTLVTDSEAYKQQLMEVYGFESSKITPLYIPATGWREGRRSEARKVLWASRISDAKLVEVAVEVGKMLRELNVELHFYGALDEEYRKNDYFINLISTLDNVHYHGVYDGFNSLDLSAYDVFLLTTKNEGMPNVVLEALLANMFVVAPAVGGVPETITDHKNGILVRDNFKPQEYFDAIATYYSSPDLQVLETRIAYNEAVRERHSWSAYSKAVRSLTDVR